MAQDLNENSEQKINLITVDPIVIISDVLKRWYIILFVVILAASGMYIYSDRRYSPQYTTETTFVISSHGNSTTVYQNMNATSNLAAVFSELINSSILRERVLTTLGLKSFNGRITSRVVPETNLLTMQVTASDPRTAFLVTRAIIENHMIVSERVMGEITFEILQKPVVPVEPSNPKNTWSQTKKAALYAFLGITALLAILSYTSDRVRSQAEAEKKLNCTVLGSMSFEKKNRTFKDVIQKKKTGLLITKPGTSFKFIEEMRKVRHRIEQHMPEGAKVLMVTSVLENEGKSTIAVNLAISMAQKRQRVLLIDADMKKPACRKILEIQEVQGSFSEVIKGKISMKEAIMQYPQQKQLYLLLQGRSVHGSDKLINSNSIQQIIESLRDVFDYIVVDTSPLSVSADSNSISALCDASILVVRQNAAAASWLRKGIDSINTDKTRFLGIIMNAVRKSGMSDQSAYGYGGYGYGSYGRYGRYGRYGKYGKYGYYDRYDKYYGRYAGNETASDENAKTSENGTNV